MSVIQKGAVSEQAKMDAFLARHPDAELHGFFSTKSDGTLSVVVLARDEPKHGGIVPCEAVEFSAVTPEMLIERASNGGFEIGDVEHVAEWCRPAWSIRRKKGRPSR